MADYDSQVLIKLLEWPFAAIKDFEKKVLNAFAILNAFQHASQLLFIASFYSRKKNKLLYRIIT